MSENRPNVTTAGLHVISRDDVPEGKIYAVDAQPVPETHWYTAGKHRFVRHDGFRVEQVFSTWQCYPPGNLSFMVKDALAEERPNGPPIRWLGSTQAMMYVDQRFPLDMSKCTFRDFLDAVELGRKKKKAPEVCEFCGCSTDNPCHSECRVTADDDGTPCSECRPSRKFRRNVIFDIETADFSPLKVDFAELELRCVAMDHARAGDSYTALTTAELTQKWPDSKVKYAIRDVRLFQLRVHDEIAPYEMSYSPPYGGVFSDAFSRIPRPNLQQPHWTDSQDFQKHLRLVKLAIFEALGVHPSLLYSPQNHGAQGMSSWTEKVGRLRPTESNLKLDASFAARIERQNSIRRQIHSEPTDVGAFFSGVKCKDTNPAFPLRQAWDSVFVDSVRGHLTIYPHFSWCKNIECQLEVIEHPLYSDDIDYAKIAAQKRTNLQFSFKSRSREGYTLEEISDLPPRVLSAICKNLFREVCWTLWTDLIGRALLTQWKVAFKEVLL